MFKSNKAITLIALIITIIVLLILAGVTINIVLGDNGLFNKAKTSVSKYENSQERENTVLSGYEAEIDNYVNGNRDISIEQRLNLLETDVNNLKTQNAILQASNTNNIQMVSESETISGTYGSVFSKTISLSGHGKGYAIITATLLDTAYSSTEIHLAFTGSPSWSGVYSSSKNIYVNNNGFLAYDESTTVKFNLLLSGNTGNCTARLEYKILFIPQYDDSEE